MINLLPPPAKKTITNEYIWRVTAVSFLLAAILLAVFTTLLLPTWQLLHLSETAVGTHLSAAQAAETAYDDLSKEVADANALIDHLYRSLPKRELAGLAMELDVLSGPAIVITDFVFNEDGSISLSGLADDRNDLADFRDRLGNDPRFINVILPVSSLAKEKDTPFTLTFSIASSSSAK